MTADEDRSQFSMWAVWPRHCLAGNALRSMSTTTRDILTNAAVIVINQDPLGRQGQLIATPQPNVQVWSREIATQNPRAVALLNRIAAPVSVTVRWSDIGLTAGNATVRDLWTHTDPGPISQSFTATAIPRHGVMMLRVTSTP